MSSGTHYIDVSGEPEFMERVAAQLHSPALQARTLLVSACGFDSVPADLGCSHMVGTGRQAGREEARRRRGGGGVQRELGEGDLVLDLTKE